VISLDQSADSTRKPQNGRNSRHLTVIGAILTAGGIGLFGYFLHSVGAREILERIGNFGILGFVVILSVFAIRIVLRAFAWKLSVYEPFSLSLRDTIPAVVIGEAMSSMIPLGILISGTAKAVAVRKRVPLVVGLSSVATENLFYSFTTSIFLIAGAYTFLKFTAPDPSLSTTIDLLIAAIVVVLLFLLVLIIRQWHFASEICEALYRRGILAGFLEHARYQVRLFENLIFGFYRRYPGRFFPICLLEFCFHALGVFEVWFIISRISVADGQLLNAFLLETVSRLITIVFKLVPFVIGVDEAGSRFVAEAVTLGAGVGITLALIRKGRILFWTAIGLALIIKRGLSLREIRQAGETTEKS
jgi:hypothetical protein